MLLFFFFLVHNDEGGKFILLIWTANKVSSHPLSCMLQRSRSPLDAWPIQNPAVKGCTKA